MREVHAGSIVTVELRTCGTEATCADALWQPVTAGMDPIVAEAFVEYRLVLTSDGWALPSIDRVEIDYRVP